MMSYLFPLAMLIMVHFICDYPLQGDFLAKAKNRMAEIPGVPWRWAMGAHVAIHGGAVYLVTGYWWLGVMEVVYHWLIDDAKCRGEITFHQDQCLHLLCKVNYVALMAMAYHL